MKKKIITVALVLSSVCVMAQQKENRDTDRNILRGPYETNGFWSNWYIGVGGGINIYEGEFDNKTSVGNRIAPALDVSLGKWITPSYGVRLQYSGLKAKGLTDASGMYAKGGASWLLQGRVQCFQSPCGLYVELVERFPRIQ